MILYLKVDFWIMKNQILKNLKLFLDFNIKII